MELERSTNFDKRHYKFDVKHETHSEPSSISGEREDNKDGPIFRSAFPVRMNNEPHDGVPLFYSTD
jgi:hypothetical protein